MIEEENINESITAQIRTTLKSDYEKIKEANKIFNINKSIHYNRNSICCHNKNTKLLELNHTQDFKESNSNCSNLTLIKKNNEVNIIDNKKDHIDNLSSLQKLFNNSNLENITEEKNTLKNFLSLACNLQNTENKQRNNILSNFNLEKNYNKNLKMNHLKFDQKPIDVDYNLSTDILVISKDKKSQLRNAHLSDEQLKENEFKGDPFGNPFKRCKEDFENFNYINANNLAVDFGEKFASEFNSDLNKVGFYNKQISEGEKNNLLFQISNSVVKKNPDDNLSVFPLRINKKRSRSAIYPGNETVNNKLSFSFLYKKTKAEDEHKIEKSKKVLDDAEHQIKGITI